MEMKENTQETLEGEVGKYKPTLGDWIPGYGYLKQNKLIRKGKPCILKDKSSGYNLMYSLVQVAPFAYAIAKGIEALTQ